MWVGDNPDGKRFLRGWLVDVVSDSETKVHRGGDSNETGALQGATCDRPGNSGYNGSA